MRSAWQKTGFALLELLIVLGILAVILLLSIPGINLLLKTSLLSTTSEEIITVLKTAQNDTLSSQNNSQYGVYFKTTTSPNQYILFKGSNYTNRDTSFDKTYYLDSSVQFSSVNVGANNEIVFDRLVGSTANSGSVTLQLTTDASQTKTMYIDNSGVVGYTALSTASDADRVKDSRHVDLAYSRTIDTANENLILTFDGSTQETIPISQNLIDNQIDWQGTYTIGGQAQTLRIHTLRLNSTDTKFSIFRDLRNNTKSLTITLSGDGTGTLAEYSADGLTTSHTSIYVNNFAWQ